MTRIALFFDCCDIATYYTKYLLRDALVEEGVECDIFSTPSPGQYCFSKEQFEKSDFYNKDVKFEIPDQKDYDVLILGARHNKSSLSLRTKVIQSFLKRNKKVIIFQDAANLDYAGNDGCTAYGMPTLNQFDLVKTVNSILKSVDKSKFFVAPLLSNLSWEKPEYCKRISREEFYDFYKISKDLKLVSFFPDGEHGHPNIPASHWLHKNLNDINSYLNSKGYQVIAKLHPYEHYGRKSEYYSGKLSRHYYDWKFPVILEEHAHELVKFSEFAISSISCVAWEHYLYRLPHLNVGMHRKKQICLRKTTSSYKNR